jgi:hypothetical protein
LTALRRFRESDEAKDVTFTVKYFPYQLYPEATKEGESKYDWYKKSRYGDSEEKMKMVRCLPRQLACSATASVLDSRQFETYVSKAKRMVVYCFDVRIWC